jgi:hypothetical protein
MHILYFGENEWHKSVGNFCHLQKLPIEKLPKEKLFTQSGHPACK